MAFAVTETIELDYREAAIKDIVRQVSGVAATPDGHLWTVSDEKRTLECLAARNNHYTLAAQIALDTLIRDLPPGDDELDLEAIGLDDKGRLWICGSHCWVRQEVPDKTERATRILPEARDRVSRHVLARLRIGAAGDSIEKARWVPLAGYGSLREVLKGDAYLDRFFELPSKENGLDIEGLAARSDKVFLGCRGPVLDSHAVVLGLTVEPVGDTGLAITPHYDRYFLNLGGLGVRDLTWWGNDLLVLAGPVTDAPGPFRLHRWTPGEPDRVATPEPLGDLPGDGEKPEGICRLSRHGQDGLILVYDSARDARIQGSRYRADWGPLA